MASIGNAGAIIGRNQAIYRIPVEVHQEIVMSLLVDALGPLLAFVVIIMLCKKTFRRSARTFDEMFPYLRDANWEGVQDLVDPADEGYLRLNLSPCDFRKAQQNRIHLLRELLKRMSHNARFLQEWATGELGKSWKTRNASARHASRELIQYCIVFRITTLLVQAKLALWSARIAILRFVPIPLLAEARNMLGTDIPYTYERVKMSAEKLARACGGRYQELLSEVL
jgi:hypothetical protein